MSKTKKERVLSEKGISEVVSYVLLIVVVISISALVYGWLRTQIPNYKAECPDDVALFVSGYSCDTSEKTITVTFQNKGLFQVDGAYVKVSDSADKVPATTISLKESDTFSSVGRIRFGTAGLASGKDRALIFDYSGKAPIVKLQVEPFVDEKIEGKTKEVICSKSTITIDVENCT